jgi:hypothetical protein
VLTTKFDKSEKIRLSDLKKWSIRSLQFQNKIKEEAKFGYLKIQNCLKHGKAKQGI